MYEHKRLQPSNQLTEQQIDIWEHAALLYHGYEWQEAADMFSELSDIVESNAHRALCLLNTGLIQARLGDYDEATQAVQEAAQVEQSNLMTAFLMGILAHQREDYSKAELCFEVCLDGLSHGGIDYTDVGNDFVLGREMILNNIRAARSAQFSARFRGETGGAVQPVETIPAEYIFEAPLRPGPFEQTYDEEIDQHSAFREVSGTKRPKSLRDILPGEKPTRPYSPGPSFWLENVPSPSLLSTSPRQDELSSIPENTQPTRGLDQRSPLMEPVRSPPPVRQMAKYRVSHRSWRGRPSTPYTPRDARTGGGSTNELARFIRGGGQPKKLTPRDARGEYESVEEMARFMLIYAPDKSGRTSPAPLDLDPHNIADLHLEQLLNQEYDKPLAASPPGQPPLGEVSTRSRAMLHQRSCPSGILRRLRGEAISTPSDSGSALSEPLSILSLSTRNESAVDGLKLPGHEASKEIRREPTVPDWSPASPGLPTNEIVSPPTSASSSDNLYNGVPAPARQHMARSLTLKKLEGEESPKRAPTKTLRLNKPLPPDPGGSGTKPMLRLEPPKKVADTETSTVASEDFFGKILGIGFGRHRK